MKSFYLLILISSLCFGQKQNDKKAKDNYEHAYDILRDGELSKERAQEALQYIEKAITLNPNKSDYFRVKGTSLFKLGQYDLALENFNKALKLDSSNLLAQTGKAFSYELKNEFVLAEENYKIALKLASVSKKPSELAYIYFNFGVLYEKWGKNDEAEKNYTLTIKTDSKYTQAYKRRGFIKINQKNTRKPF